MPLGLWVCRDTEEGVSDGNYVFYRYKKDAQKDIMGYSSRNWMWTTRKAVLDTHDGEGALLLKKAGLSIKPGEGPKKVKITIEEV